MIAVGLILLAAAAVAASVLIAQNAHSVIEIHAFGRVWDVHLYWVVVAGMVIAAVAALGVAAISRGGLRLRRVRRERGLFAAENERIADSRDGLRFPTARPRITGEAHGRAGDSGAAPG